MWSREILRIISKYISKKKIVSRWQYRWVGNYYDIECLRKIKFPSTKVSPKIFI